MSQKLIVIISDSEQDINNINTNVRNIGLTTAPIYRNTVSEVIRDLREKEEAGVISATINALFILDLKIGDHRLGGEEILKNRRRKGYRSPVLIKSNYIAGITNEATATARLIAEGLDRQIRWHPLIDSVLANADELKQRAYFNIVIINY